MHALADNVLDNDSFILRVVSSVVQCIVLVVTNRLSQTTAL